MAKITTDNVSTRRCGRRSAQEQGARVPVLTGPRGTYYWQYTGGDKATTRRREAGTQQRTVEKDLSDVSHTPTVDSEAVEEEAESEVRRNSTTVRTAARLMDGDQKGNSRFVHARTNHVQRKNDTGRTTWAFISRTFTVDHARLSPPTRDRGSWHSNQS